MAEIPQAIRRLWPISTIGTPGKEKPATSNRPAWSPFSYQTEGMSSWRWVSLASIGLPVAVRLPWTTQLLLPTATAVSLSRAVSSSPAGCSAARRASP